MKPAPEQLEHPEAGLYRLIGGWLDGTTVWSERAALAVLTIDGGRLVYSVKDGSMERIDVPQPPETL